MCGITGIAPSQSPRVVEAERLTPVPNRFIGHGDTSFGEEILDISETHARATGRPWDLDRVPSPTRSPAPSRYHSIRQQTLCFKN